MSIGEDDDEDGIDEEEDDDEISNAADDDGDDDDDDDGDGERGATWMSLGGGVEKQGDADRFLYASF